MRGKRLCCRKHLACSRLSDSGKDAKVKGTRKVGGVKKRKRKGEADMHKKLGIFTEFSNMIITVPVLS